MPMIMKSLRLGDMAPDFSAKTTAGDLESFHSYIGNEHWAILFSHPSAFSTHSSSFFNAV
ncbi:hypothetical protein HMI54_010868 [Coelomomyces lativittatus]|nr:hypothetical protein HMI54_010868 [Coelomomyces lativittatus]KAJ1500661.1 hypothetical protein HMI56_003697 [Coelomomyces lativittatus]